MDYVTEKRFNRLKFWLMLASGIAIGTVIGVILVLWMIWAFLDGFS